MEQFRLVRTRWGWFAVVARGSTLIHTFLPVAREADALTAVRRVHPHAEPNDGILPELCGAVRDYFAGLPALFPAKLDLQEFTPFQRRVIRAARKIGYGQTSSYGELARRAGAPGAARAVGSVMRHNRFPLIVPCHRVLAAGGALGGFSSPGGLDEKRALLALECGERSARSTRRRTARA